MEWFSRSTVVVFNFALSQIQGGKMPRCSVPGCDNDASKQECSSLGWFGYPLGEDKKGLLRQWLCRVNRVDFHPNRYARICSAHFTDDSFKEDYCYLESFVASGDIEPANKRRRARQLKDGAVPSIFPDRYRRGEHAPSRSRTSSYLKRKAHREVSLLLAMSFTN